MTLSMLPKDGFINGVADAVSVDDIGLRDRRHRTVDALLLNGDVGALVVVYSRL